MKNFVANWIYIIVNIINIIFSTNDTTEKTKNLTLFILKISLSYHNFSLYDLSTHFIMAYLSHFSIIFNVFYVEMYMCVYFIYGYICRFQI